MRSLDTNVLVRYLVGDNPAQFAAAEGIIEECRHKQERMFISVIVLCELVWVLGRKYQQSKSALVHALDGVLRVDLFEVEQPDLVRRALESYRKGKGNFSDYLIGEISRDAGCRDTVTFDLALKGASGFTVLS